GAALDEQAIGAKTGGHAAQVRMRRAGGQQKLPRRARRWLGGREPTARASKASAEERRVDPEADRGAQHGLERRELHHPELGPHIGKHHAPQRKDDAHNESNAGQARRKPQQALLHPPPSSTGHAGLVEWPSPTRPRCLPHSLYKIAANPSVPPQTS